MRVDRDGQLGRGGVVIESIINSRLVRVVLDQQSPLKSRIRVRVALHCPTVEAQFQLKTPDKS